MYPILFSKFYLQKIFYQNLKLLFNLFLWVSLFVISFVKFNSKATLTSKSRISFLLLAWFERLDPQIKMMNILKTFGAAPMFFYILHLYALLVIYWALIVIFGSNQGDLFGVNNFGWVWLVSIIMSVALYFPTKKFARYKKQNNQTWLRYF